MIEPVGTEMIRPSRARVRSTRYLFNKYLRLTSLFIACHRVPVNLWCDHPARPHRRHARHRRSRRRRHQDLRQR